MIKQRYGRGGADGLFGQPSGLTRDKGESNLLSFISTSFGWAKRSVACIRSSIGYPLLICIVLTPTALERSSKKDQRPIRPSSVSSHVLSSGQLLL